MNSISADSKRWRTQFIAGSDVCVQKETGQILLSTEKEILKHEHKQGVDIQCSYFIHFFKSYIIYVHVPDTFATWTNISY